VSTAAALAYWLGNPLLNPAVLVFLLFVAPWQWTATRLVVGVLIVVGGSALVARLVEGRQAEERTDLSRLTDEVEEDGGAEPVGREWLARAPKRFGQALLRLSVVLVPEYLVIVLLIGAFRGWLFPVGGTLGSGVLVVTLPAVSLPGVAMVGRALGWRTTALTTAVVAVGGLLGAGLLAVL